MSARFLRLRTARFDTVAFTVVQVGCPADRRMSVPRRTTADT
jgi:hypothetical protein